MIKRGILLVLIFFAIYVTVETVRNYLSISKVGWLSRKNIVEEQYLSLISDSIRPLLTDKFSYTNKQVDTIVEFKYLDNQIIIYRIPQYDNISIDSISIVYTHEQPEMNTGYQGLAIPGMQPLYILQSNYFNSEQSGLQFLIRGDSLVNPTYGKNGFYCDLNFRCIAFSQNENKYDIILSAGEDGEYKLTSSVSILLKEKKFYLIFAYSTKKLNLSIKDILNFKN
jgi:hypothetical protein